MGRAAERLADRLVITNDNPRSESPDKIIADIVAGLANESRATIIEDRGAAIAWAIAHADANDVVLIAGKGHENYQIIGDERLDFSDYGAAAGNLAALAGQAGA
jgi:UDP-N-acetylmuramoyl-L-alanyl-D-glutamate--2,6-diaminopimelate ligase